MAYSRFLAADELLRPKGCDNAPGDHTTLFVEKTSKDSKRKAKRKRAQVDHEDELTQLGALMAATG